jgi:hypothetical protein
VQRCVVVQCAPERPRGAFATDVVCVFREAPVPTKGHYTGIAGSTRLIALNRAIKELFHACLRVALLGDGVLAPAVNATTGR